MQTNQILSAPLLDIIFDGRNKAYGAYELRKTYEKRIRKAMIITFSLAALAFGSVVMASTFKKKDDQYRLKEEMMLTEIKEIQKPEPLPEQPKPKPAEPDVQTIKSTTLEVKPDDQVDVPPPSQIDVVDARIDDNTKKGTIDDGTVDPGPPSDGVDKGVFDDKPAKPEEPAETVDIDAKFDGNWKRFLESNLVAEVPVNNGAPAGRYSVVVKFVVDVDGSISNIQALTNHGYGLEEEAIRVIKKSKKWGPAYLNGSHVKAYKKQVIVFEVVED